MDCAVEHRTGVDHLVDLCRAAAPRDGPGGSQVERAVHGVVCPFAWGWEAYVVAGYCWNLYASWDHSHLASGACGTLPLRRVGVVVVAGLGRCPPVWVDPVVVLGFLPRVLVRAHAVASQWARRGFSGLLVSGPYAVRQ